MMSSRLTSLGGSSFSSAYYCSLLILCLLATGCESTPRRAPVTDSIAVESQDTASKPGTAMEAGGLRPSFYTIQKGDTLYSIALNHGIDQKDLAQWNNIQDPGAIHIGQQLNLFPPSQLAQPSLFPLPEQAPPSAAPNIAGSLEEKRMINTGKLKIEPKAFKLPYSEQAVAQLKGLPVAPPAVVLKADTAAEKNVEASVNPISAAPEPVPGDDRVEWIWPVKGKLLEGFSEGTKGIDIGGKLGQQVSASAAGKVVYSGAGLRGYGKLIIIKHNNTFLSAYAHNSKLLVKEGQIVAKGQKIAEMGNTDAALVKLHFEIRKNGKPVDPLKHLPQIAG